MGILQGRKRKGRVKETRERKGRGTVRHQAAPGKETRERGEMETEAKSPTNQRQTVTRSTMRRRRMRWDEVEVETSSR
jgi:hypothetical protein